MNTSTTRVRGPTTRAGLSTDNLPAAIAGFQRPTIEQEWWSVTTVRWNEMLADASGNNKTKATTALNTLRKYHDANAIMLSNFGKDAPAGHCKQCWDKKKKEPKRKCRVYAERTEGQSLACAFCRLKGHGGCDANPKEDEEEEEEEAPDATATALLNRVAELETQQEVLKTQQEKHYSEVAVLHQKLADEVVVRQDLSKRVAALEQMIAAAATILSQ